MAFTSGDPNAISLAFAQYGEALIAALVPVPERGAVQILGCDQEIVAHIPVSQATLDLLRSEYGV